MSFLGGIMADVVSEDSYEMFENMGDFFSDDVFQMMNEIGTNASIDIFQPAFDEIMFGGGSVQDRIDGLEDIVGEGNVGQVIGPNGEHQIVTDIPGTDEIYIYNVDEGYSWLNEHSFNYELLIQLPHPMIFDPYMPVDDWVIT